MCKNAFLAAGRSTDGFRARKHVSHLANARRERFLWRIYGCFFFFFFFSITRKIKTRQWRINPGHLFSGTALRVRLDVETRLNGQISDDLSLYHATVETFSKRNNHAHCFISYNSFEKELSIHCDAFNYLRLFMKLGTSILKAQLIKSIGP